MSLLTSVSSVTQQVRAVNAQLSNNVLTVFLSDSREISVHLEQLEWLKWLAKATPEQQAQWSIEPGGFALYWEALDDGIEISHLLGMQEVL